MAPPRKILSRENSNSDKIEKLGQEILMGNLGMKNSENSNLMPGTGGILKNSKNASIEELSELQGTDSDEKHSGHLVSNSSLKHPWYYNLSSNTSNKKKKIY